MKKVAAYIKYFGQTMKKIQAMRIYMSYHQLFQKFSETEQKKYFFKISANLKMWIGMMSRRTGS